MTYDMFSSFKKRLNESYDTRFDDVTACTSTSTPSKSTEQLFDDAFESVYGLKSDSATSLNEDFGSFPDWLKNFLVKDRGVKMSLNKRGVDLAHATYISGKLPQNARDAAFKDPSRLAVFRMVDTIGGTHEVIYIPGINDPDVYPDPNNRWSRYRASAISKKKLLELTKEYGYIDMNDSRNSNIALRNQRYHDKQGMVVRDREAGQTPQRYNVQYGTDERGYTDFDNVISFDVKWVTKRGYDKSGYKLDPDKYGRMLDNVGLDDYSIRLQMLYNQIESARTRLIALMSKYSVLDSTSVRVSRTWSRNIFGDISRVVDDFSRAIDTYTDLEEDVQRIVNSDKLDDSKKSERIHDTFTWNGKRLRDYIKEINTALRSIESAEKV